jgi:hypothetical protein
MTDERHIGEILRELLVGMGIIPEGTSTIEVQQLLDAINKPRPPSLQKATISSLQDPNLRLLAQRLTDTLVENHPEDIVNSLRKAIGSRKLGLYIELEIPLLNNRQIILDTRNDNGPHCPESLRQLTSGTTGSPWPAPNPRISYVSSAGELRPLGCPGSSCPRSGARAALNGTWDTAQVPVDIVAFHAEGHNGEVAYAVRMFSDVTGRLDIPLNPNSPAIPHDLTGSLGKIGNGAALEISGQMLVTVVPDKPEDFAGMKRIELVSQGVVTQRGIMSQWPPRLGDFLQTVGTEAYVSVGSPTTVLAVVKTGRIIFSDEEDPFLQARTRVNTFIFTNERGGAIVQSEPIENIRGVRLLWDDIRNRTNRVTHYRVYRAIPGDRSSIRMISDEVFVPQYVDHEYDGTKTFSYAIVPCTRNVLGDEVIGIGLDYVSLSYVRATSDLHVDVEHVTGHLGFQ